MSAPVLARIRRSAAQIMDEVFAEEWSAKQLNNLLREVEEAAQEFAGLPARVRDYHWQCCHLLMASAEKRQPIDYKLLGESVVEMFESALLLMNTLLKWMQRLEQAGHPVSGVNELAAKVCELEKERDESVQRWPWPPTQEEVAEATAEYERGDSLPLDEAFAEIAGVSKEEWLTRVERRRQELREAGGGNR